MANPRAAASWLVANRDEPEREVECWLEQYEPRHVSGEAWHGYLRAFVVPAVRRLAPAGPAIAGRNARVLTRISAWCFEQGLPLDPEVVLDPDTVERFTMFGLADDPSRGTYRADLRRIGPKLTAKAPWEPRPKAATRRQVATPYLSEELAALRHDATHQATPARRRAAMALLALGAGTGLDGRWATRVRAEDVNSQRDVVFVRVGEPSARLVPVLAHYEAELVDLAATAEDKFLVGGNSLARNRAGELASRIEVSHATPRLSASRLRSTWLVHHLSLGTRLPELVAAAGLSGATVLSDLVEYVPPLATEEAHRLLRGPEP